jgi:hypothetical protein
MQRRRAHGRAILFAVLHAVGCDAEATARDAASEVDARVLSAEVESILTRSCAYERCHSGALIGGALDLSRGRDYRAALVSVPACQYERMARVEPGDPERSWLMVKLTAEFRDRDDPYAYYIHFTPAPDWDPNERACRDQTDDGTPLFGQRMPLTAPNMLPAQELDTIAAWIASGAP